MKITASILYDYTQCPHKVWRDIYGPRDEKRDEPNPFVKLLWERGVRHEEEVVRKLGKFINLSDISLDLRPEVTVNEMKRGAPLIYQGALAHGNLFGVPDLLEKLPDGSYIPVDIKSGMAFSGRGEDSQEENKKYKKHYAVQLCLYNELLKSLGFASHDNGRILDGKNNDVLYDLNQYKDKRKKISWWDYYGEIKEHAFLLMQNKKVNYPAKASVCKMCEWYEGCFRWCDKSNDPSGIFYLGRSKRDILKRDLNITNVTDLTDLNIDDAIVKKKAYERDKIAFLPQLAEKTLITLKRRAVIFDKKDKPVAYKKFEFPKAQYELFFDIEDDPTREFVYLHGIYERAPEGKRYLDFTAKEVSEEEERKAWKEFWKYIFTIPNKNYSVYYYSPHERTVYRKLREKYPDIVSEDDLNEFFSKERAVDLYNDVVLKHTDWPLSSYSLKEIARYLGFDWRDESPSGADSIQWFNEYVEKKDESMLKRILLYNEDDCKATMVLKDGIERLEVIDDNS